MDVLQVRLTELRNERELTQKDLASQLGVSASAIGFWENGINEPKATYLLRLATFFGVTADYLLGLEDDFGAHAVAPLNSDYTKEERKFIEDLRKLTPGMRDILRTTLNAMINDTNEGIKI